MSYAIARMTNNIWPYTESDIAIGSFLVSPDTSTHYIPVINLSDVTQTLHEGSRLGDVFPIKSQSLKQFQEMLWVDPQLSDRDWDDEVLLDVRTASVEGSSDKVRGPHSDTWLDTDGHHPIRLAHRRFPITNHDVEKAEDQKMLG